MFVTYLTIYDGDKLPPFYIGSTSKARHDGGYLGSVRSKKYRAAWEQELQEHPELFDSIIIDEFEARDESLAAELALQRKHRVVSSPLFINMGLAKKGFTNPGVGGFAESSIEKMRLAKLGKKQTPEHAANAAKARTGCKRTPEQKETARLAALTRKKAPPATAETRAKLRASTTAYHARRKARMSQGV
jgi:hypothetical protein